VYVCVCRSIYLTGSHPKHALSSGRHPRSLASTIAAPPSCHTLARCIAAGSDGRLRAWTAGRMGTDVCVRGYCMDVCKVAITGGPLAAKCIVR
jgi:hypothetical protein